MQDPQGFLEKHRNKRILFDEIHRLDNPSEVLKLAADYYPDIKIILGVIIIDALIILESVAFMLLKRELKVPPANWLGKSKMVFQVLGLFLTILYLLFDSLVALQLSVIFFYLVIIIGVFNLVNYALRSLKMFK